VAEPDGFLTDVVKTTGKWPLPPSWWSYSALKEVEQCPRRWMLRRASYPDIWTKRGYPELPTLPALVGDVIHRALELVIDALARRGCETANAPCAVQTMQELGGYTAVVSSAAESRLAVLEGNPRVQARVATLRQALDQRRPDMRRRVQAVISMTEMRPIDSEAVSADHVPGARVPLADGSHTEVELRAPVLGWMGRADLLTVLPTGCEITDYKTGSPDNDYVEQLQTYALLWSRDSDLNPSAQLASHLVLRFPSGDQVVPTPDAGKLRSIENDLTDRTTRAELELRKRPPAARPAVETCKGCSVRHLCSEYWGFLDHGGAAIDHQGEGQFGDVELKVIERHGARSWQVQVVHGSQALGAVVLRTPSESVTFDIGSHQRILNAALGVDDDSNSPILTMTSASEAFELTI